MEPLKNIYSEKFLLDFAHRLGGVYTDFDEKKFINKTISPPWPDLELKQRMSRIADVTIELLPSDVFLAAAILEKLCEEVSHSTQGMNFGYMFVPECIEKLLLPHPERAFEAFEKITSFTSCEFAVRIFLIKHQELGMAYMNTFADSTKEGVRRFASEGCRPRLPWAMALPALKKDPSPIFPILHKLMDDPSEFVRRSVANNLNDISKDHEDLVLDFARKHLSNGVERKKLIKHGLRTLLKKGHTQALNLFGSNAAHFEMVQFQTAATVRVGDYLTFEFGLANTDEQTLDLRIEYAIYFKLANGSHNKKVFKITERKLAASDTLTINKRHSFKPITTRKYYKGEHHLSIIINGREQSKASFLLV